MQDILKAKDVIKFGLRGYKETVDYNWHGRVITIKYLLPIDEMCSTIRNIQEMCLSKDGEFIAEFLDYAIRLNIVTSYAYIEMPDDFEEMYKLIYHSDLYEAVLSNANKKQIESILLFFGMDHRS